MGTSVVKHYMHRVQRIFSGNFPQHFADLYRRKSQPMTK
jgi:hypothetical protein